MPPPHPPSNTHTYLFINVSDWKLYVFISAVLYQIVGLEGNGWIGRRLRRKRKGREGVKQKSNAGGDSSSRPAGRTARRRLTVRPSPFLSPFARLTFHSIALSANSLSLCSPSVAVLVPAAADVGLAMVWLHTSNIRKIDAPAPHLPPYPLPAAVPVFSFPFYKVISRPSFHCCPIFSDLSFASATCKKMVKTDDFILMMEDGSCATATLTTSTTAVLMEKMVAEKVKNGGTDGKRGELLIEAVDDAMARHDVWLPESHSPDTKCSSADFDQSDESGGDQSGVSNGSHRNCRFSMDGRANDRRMFTASIANDVDDRRLRRQIANCNERRRMQSINDGFQALRQLLPRKDGDKMSKAAILAATAEFIQSLLREKDKLMEENCAVTAKKRRMDTEDTTDQDILREEMAAPNVVECLSTIGDLRILLQKETQLRMAYEKEMAELRCQLRLSPPSSALVSLPPFPSPLPPSDFASISSSSSSAMANGREGLLIELVRHQEQQPQLFRPTAVLPSDVQLLTSAINSLANCSPGGLPLQMQQQQENNGPMIMSTNEMPTEIGTEAQQPTKVFETKVPLPVVQQRTMKNGEETNGWPTTEGVGVGTDCATTATISQQNLQALVLAIRHLEGSANVSSPLQNSCPPPVLSSAADNNLVLFH